jgi:hypothetical protein
MFVERAVQLDRFDDHLVHEITIGQAGYLRSDHAIGVRIVVAAAPGKVATPSRIGDLYQVFGSQVGRGIVDPDAGRGFGLGLVHITGSVLAHARRHHPTFQRD